MFKIEEGFMLSNEICHAKDHNSAKVILLKAAISLGIGLNSEPSEITYLNIPVVRHPAADTYYFEDEDKTVQEIEMILIERDRQTELNKIIANSEIEYCYIMKRGTYYRSNYAGYTEHKMFAGVYPKKDAVIHARGVCEITILPINKEEHNLMISNEITDLTTRFI